MPGVTTRSSLMILLLVAEAIGLTIFFDTGILENSLSDRLTDLARYLFQCLTLVGVVLLLFGPRFRERLWQGVSGSGSYRRFGMALLVHGIVFAIFAWLTGRLFEGPAEHHATELWITISWVVMGVATLATWLAILLPPSRWIGVAKSEPGITLIGVGAGVAAWITGGLANEFWHPIGPWTLRTVHFLLKMVTRETVYEPANWVVGTPSFQIELAPQCSGYEGMGMMLVLIGAYLWLSRRNLRFPQAWLLLPLGILLIWIANAMRLAMLILLGTAGFERVAAGGFHSQAGWLAFIAVSLGLITVSKHWSFVAIGNEAPGDRADRCPTAAYLLPLMFLIATGMITRAFSEGFDWLYPARVVAAGLVFWAYRFEYGSLRFHLSWQPVALGILAFGVWMVPELLDPSPADQRTSAPAELIRGSGLWRSLWLVFRVIGAAITVPIAEELAFRGYLTRRLISADYARLPIGVFTVASFLGSSALFGLLHSHWVTGTLAGMIYAYALYRRKRLFDPILAHATTNALIAATVLSTGNWAIWQD